MPADACAGMPRRWGKHRLQLVKDRGLPGRCRGAQLPSRSACAVGKVLGEFYNPGYQCVNNPGYSLAQKKTRSVRAPTC